MTALPQPTHGTVQAIYAAYEKRRAAEPARAYLGASIIGHACDRYLWLSFRWADVEQFDGRMLRLFDTGQRAEARFVDELRSIGAKVQEVDPATGRQWSVQAVSGHFRGHMDGKATGIPEAPKSPHILEFKTHSAKSFKDLVAKGVAAAKPMHMAQMQVYMLLDGADRALYLAENKDTSEIYAERVTLDKPAAHLLIRRAERIVAAAEPPQRLSDDPAWHVCKYCPFHGQCHGTVAPQVNCRTCTHSTPNSAGGWDCAKHEAQDIPLDFQPQGCESHRFIPIMLERIGRAVDVRGDDVVYRKPEGSEFANGEPPAGLTSREIRACEDKRALFDGGIQQLREQFDARITA